MFSKEVHDEIIKGITDMDAVESVLSDHKNLQHLQEVLEQDIATLDGDLIKEQAVEASLVLLNNYISIELSDEKAKNTQPTTAPFPRSIRLKTTLTCSEKATRETEEFATLLQSAETTKLAYQQKMRQLIVATINLDIKTKKKQLRDTYFESLATMIETQVYYQNLILPTESKFKDMFRNRGGAKTASAYLCINIMNNAKNTTNELYDVLEGVQKYLEIDKAEFTTQLFHCFNTQDAESLQADSTITIEEDELKLVTDSVLNIINYSATKMTVDLLSVHQTIIKERNAKAMTEATFNNKKTEETTIEVTTAIAEESTMPPQRMQDFINKLVDKRMYNNEKNMKSGKTKNSTSFVNATSVAKNKSKTTNKKKKRNQYKKETTKSNKVTP
jgi:hypothetical protein